MIKTDPRPSAATGLVVLIIGTLACLAMGPGGIIPAGILWYWVYKVWYN